MDSAFNAHRQQSNPREMADHICRILEAVGVGKEVSLLPVYHLTQMTLLAVEILSVVAGFSQISGRVEFISVITNLRQHAVVFRKHVLELSKMQPPLFDALDILAAAKREHYDFGVPTNEFRQEEADILIAQLSGQLKGAGAGEINAAEFAGELVEFAEDLGELVWLVDIFVKLDQPNCRQLWCLWIDIIEAWDREWTSRGLTHLGTDEPEQDTGEPGFLGRSRVLLDELMAIEFE